MSATASPVAERSVVELPGMPEGSPGGVVGRLTIGMPSDRDTRLVIVSATSMENRAKSIASSAIVW